MPFFIGFGEAYLPLPTYLFISGLPPPRSAARPMEPSDFLTEVDEELICCICHEVLLMPMVCREGHTFCEACIESWLERNNTCPMDRKNLEKTDLTPVRIVANMIDKMEVRCPNHAAGLGGGASGSGSSSGSSSGRGGGGSGGGGGGSAAPPEAKKRKQTRGKEKANAKTVPPEGGCAWTGTVASRLAHLRDECAFTETECNFGSCGHSMPRHELDEHRNGCVYRMGPCPHCADEMEQRELGDHIETSCPRYEIACPRQCGERFLREEEGAHAAECALAMVACPFAQHGCPTAELMRKDYADHQVGAAGEHAALTATGLSRLEDLIRTVRDDVRAEMQVERERLGDTRGRVSALEDYAESGKLCWTIPGMAQVDFSCGRPVHSSVVQMNMPPFSPMYFQLGIRCSASTRVGNRVHFHVAGDDEWYSGTILAVKIGGVPPQGMAPPGAVAHFGPVIAARITAADGHVYEVPIKNVVGHDVCLALLSVPGPNSTAGIAVVEGSDIHINGHRHVR